MQRLEKPKIVCGSKETPNETDRISIGWSCNAGRGCRLHEQSDRWGFRIVVAGAAASVEE
jgi:hypothetical protein